MSAKPSEAQRILMRRNEPEVQALRIAGNYVLYIRRQQQEAKVAEINRAGPF